MFLRNASDIWLALNMSLTLKAKGVFLFLGLQKQHLFKLDYKTHERKMFYNKHRHKFPFGILD